ncbi:MAG: SPOR domain-containing protein, partial [Pseudomonadota bacterium]
GVDPGPNEVRTIDLTPPGPSGRDEAATEAVVLPVPADSDRATGANGPSESPAGTAVAQTEPEPEAEPEPATASPAAAEPEPEPPAEAAAPPASASGMFAVQLGSFSARDNADKLAAGLRGLGFAAFISEHRNGGRTLHRVRVGPLADRAAAEAEAARLSGRGHNGRVVPHP